MACFRKLTGGETSDIAEYLDEYTAAATRLQPLLPKDWVLISAGPGICVGNPRGGESHAFTDTVIRAMLAYLDTPMPEAALDALTDEGRLEVFGMYCTHCGEKNPGCQCWNDD